jgi:hypothetical protein
VRNSSRILLPVCLLASVVATGQPGTHDLKIATRHSSRGSEFTTTIYYSGGNSRSEMQIFSGNVKGHHRAIIRRKGAESIQVYDLDLDIHEYVSYQTDLNGGVPSALAKSFVGKPSGKTYVINTDVVDTGERKEMFGHIARHLITKEKRIGGSENCYGGNSESEIDGWYIDYDALPLAQRPRTGISAHLVTHTGSIGSSHCFDKIEAHRTGPPKEFPLKETTNWPGEAPSSANGSSQSFSSTTEVIEFMEAPLDPALFEVPPDFKKVKEIIDPTQQRLQSLTCWERFKYEPWSFFH